MKKEIYTFEYKGQQTEVLYDPEPDTDIYDRYKYRRSGEQEWVAVPKLGLEELINTMLDDMIYRQSGRLSK